MNILKQSIFFTGTSNHETYPAWTEAKHNLDRLCASKDSKCLNRKPMQCHRETSYHISKAETRQGPVLNLRETPEELGFNGSE